MTTLTSLDPVVALAKRRGFVYPSAEIYGGTGSVWDYGPLGAEMKRTIKELWWRRFVRAQDSVYGLDSAIITRPEVLRASGHEASFTDPLVECQQCHERFRFDHLQEGQYGTVKKNEAGALICPNCGGTLTDPKQFNLMFKTFIGSTEDNAALAYLRPETAQGIFTNFKNVVDTYRVKLPFGIAQIGKAFRNEVTPGNFIFRTREFEQCELEWFVAPESVIHQQELTDEAAKRTAANWYDYWIEQSHQWFLDYGVNPAKIRLREHDKDELSHYAKAATDVEYEFPFGWAELMGIASRGDYDVSQHQEHSNRDLTYFDPITNSRFIPEVIEPSMGVDRALLTFLVDAFEEVAEDQPGGRSKGETVLHLHPQIAPVKAAVLPLSNKGELPELAREIYHVLQQHYNVMYDAGGSIGRRYRRQDEIGTPFCLTVDFDSATGKDVTVRDRDSLKQERVKINELEAYLAERLK